MLCVGCHVQDDDDGDGSESEFLPDSEEASESEGASDPSDAVESGVDEADANDRAASRRKGEPGACSAKCSVIRQTQHPVDLSAVARHPNPWV
jgi:hypothetical protein